MQYFKVTFMFLGIAYDVLMERLLKDCRCLHVRIPVCLLKPVSGFISTPNSMRRKI